MFLVPIILGQERNIMRIKELKTCEDVQGLTSEIIHTLQDDYGYLKPQEFTTAGNVQGNGIYNWSAHEVIEELIKKRFNIEEE